MDRLERLIKYDDKITDKCLRCQFLCSEWYLGNNYLMCDLGFDCPYTEDSKEDDEIDLPIKHESKPYLMIPLPNGATNGDVIKALFPDIEIYDSKVMESIYTGIPFGEYIGANVDCMRDWWNAPYERR